jgi:hypothetical protein
LAALGLVAFAAAGAQAEWLIEKKALTGIELIKVTQHTEALLLVPGQNLIIHCKELTSVLGDLSVLDGTGGLLLASAELLYKLCTTLQKNELKEGCKPAEPIVAKVLGHLILHGEANKLTYILFEPDGGDTFATVKYNGATCSLPETNKIKGKVVAECLNEKLETKAQTGIDECLKEMLKHLIQEAPETLFPTDVLTYGTNQALLDGIASIQLDKSDLLWCGHV